MRKLFIAITKIQLISFSNALLSQLPCEKRELVSVF